MLSLDASGHVLIGENDQVEYKSIFDGTNKKAKTKYLKTMAAMYNAYGGYLIFGVDDDLKLVGLSNFIKPDNADLGNDANSYFQPAIRFSTRAIIVYGKEVFVIHVPRRTSTPTVCVKDFSDMLVTGQIYWRYSGKSAPIQPGDLIDLLNAQGHEMARANNIAEREFRSRFKPRIRALGQTSGFEFGINLRNEGGEASIDNYSVIEASASLEQLTLLPRKPFSLRNGGSEQIGGHSSVRANDLTFKVKLFYHDLENYRYETIIQFDRGHVKTLETTDL